MGRLTFCLFVLFVAILFPFFYEALVKLRKMLIKLFDVQFGNCSTLRYPDSADLQDLQRCN